MPRQFPEVIQFRVDDKLAVRIRERAALEARTVSNYLRLVVLAGLASAHRLNKQRTMVRCPARRRGRSDGSTGASKWNADDDLVFAHPHSGEPLQGTPLGKRFRKARDAAKVPAVTFHELRHRFGTTLARAGWPVGGIQALVGHANLDTTQRYMHYAPRHDQGERIAAAFATADPRIATSASNVGSPEVVSAA